MAADFYTSHTKVYLAIDCIVFGFQRGELKLLIQQRNFEPFQGVWSLMGGFVEENENLYDAAKRICEELTGLKNVYMQQVGTFGAVDRDPGARVVSVAYYALLNVDKYNPELNIKNNAHWENINTLPQLYFDHAEMVETARDVLKRKIAREPIGFNLLPPLFTLSQLQSLHEAILGESIDKRNFRKKVNEMSYIEKTDIIDKTGSKRGAHLYRFNDRIYRKEHKFKLM
ncbi:MAG: NUDIX hydrolase [Paraprevotella sp.]|nr:NUDIX hydrolase [Paraprevotella sp.]MBP3471367.1 NUDIX hydrolase [Paraprevotella sp.]